MELHDFMTNIEIEKISKNIKNGKEFYLDKKVGAYNLIIQSAKAGTNWDNNTQKGDYIICINFFTSTRGHGIPLSGAKLKAIEDVDKLTIYLDNYLKNSQIKGYQGIDEGQISLFTLIN